MRNKLTQTTLSFVVGIAFTPMAQAPASAAEAAATPTAVQTQAAATLQEGRPPAARDLFVTVGKSLVVDSPVNIQRVSVANGELAEALAVNPREVLVNGKAAGETSMIIWQQGGNRLFFDLTIRPSNSKAGGIQQQIDRELPGQDIKVTFENDAVFLHGTVKDLTSAERAVAIASTLGKTVNLLRVNVPPTEAQILIKVRFADIDRVAAQDLGVNILSTGATNTIGSITTGAYSPPLVVPDQGTVKTTITDTLNLWAFRPDLNLGAMIKALENDRVLQILAEPNVLAINGRTASFLAGGEFPYPTLQGGGGGLGAVTIQFREFGVRINFTPVITPRGTIRLQVMPEVSSLDFANGLNFQGFTIPALSTRRVQTEIELEDGQSFVIGGLLDNRVTETLSKIPGLANIPLLGKLFQSRGLSKNNTELLVLVTPELVRPVPKGQPRPDLKMPIPFMKGTRPDVPQSPGMDVTGPVPVKPAEESVPVEQLIQNMKALPSTSQQSQPQIQFVPMLTQPGQAAQPVAPPASPAAPPPSSAAGSPTGTGGGSGSNR
ncbi:MAG TPA: pilus assembly protein N-terminal domain-containing protein [Bryobacteraceae bacterium]|nr:pilus assembly protein N-terminal domain-containing protein [Bryobacteraceae bacterium]